MLMIESVDGLRWVVPLSCSDHGILAGPANGVLATFYGSDDLASEA